MQALERAFLGGGSVPPRLDEDAPAITTIMATMATGLVGPAKS
jgi:hypothetical protein